MRTSNSTTFSIKSRIKSFKYALEGMVTFFRTQHNSWIHLLAAIIAVAGGIYLNLNTLEWFMVITSIALVFIVEMLNTAIEFLCNKVESSFDPQIKRIKDVSAAAVLVAAIFACVVGGIVFIPKLF